VNRITDDEIDSMFTKSAPPPISARAKEWNRLLDLIPELAAMVGRRRNVTAPPTDLSTFMFLAFIACFADPKRAAVLRAVIFDNQQDNLHEIILALLTREGDGDEKPE